MDDRYRNVLKQIWGYDDFRGIQREIIESIASGHDTLGLMPTGGGKSITFQVPAMLTYGTCIVVTPLIALMKDQVQQLRSHGIKATAVYSGMSHQEILTALENCILGNYKFLYVSPERLESELFLKKLSHMKVSFITVDEAHCISQWGYDFRPSYLQIVEIRKIVPHAPVLALTASATPEVVEDIQEKLNFRDGNVFRMSFERKNLTYIVRRTASKFQEIVHILKSIPGSAIIYTRNRQQTHELAQQLCDEGFTATNYHAGLQQIQKDDRQERWQNNEYRIMVATNAFGMGIDKPDVRLVLHTEVPDSPEAYFQEAGRAGRDGAQAYAVLIYDEKDCKKLLRRIPETYPEPEYIRDVYEHMCYYFQMAMGDGAGVTREFDLMEFCYRFKYFPVVAHNALLLLNNAGYIEYTDQDEITSRIRFLLTRDELYRLHEQGPTIEKVIQALLRKYSGLFSDFVYIDENLLARDTQLTVEQVYRSLKQLAKQRIAEYIPRKKTDYITFRCRRVEKEEVQLPASVYKERKKQYEQRIESMIQYVTDRDICHSRFLLRYFGENDTYNCGRCDICTSQTPTTSESDAIRQAVIKQLSLRPLFPREFDITGFNREKFAQVVRQMVLEEEVTLNERQQFILNLSPSNQSE